MRIPLRYVFSQVNSALIFPRAKISGKTKLLIFICLPLLFSCTSKKEDALNIIPPVTSPLSGDYIGFGVITESFTHITESPNEVSVSAGYIRRGAVVNIIKRQAVKTDSGFISWVLIEENADVSAASGWLKENVMMIYDTKSQAETASESMGR